MAIEKVKSGAAATSIFGNSIWKTPAFRQSMVDRLNNVIEDTGVNLQCSGVELENGVFQKVNSKPMYMILIICIIENIKEMAENNIKAPGLDFTNHHTHELSEFESLLLQ